jgi:hypothetical protein
MSRTLITTLIPPNTYPHTSNLPASLHHKIPKPHPQGGGFEIGAPPSLHFSTLRISSFAKLIV